MRVVIKLPKNPFENQTISVNGVSGTSCTELTSKIEEALGAKVDDTMTEEYYHDQVQEQQLEQGE